MKKYISFFRIRFFYNLQYRTAALAGIATQFAWGGMLILMYRAFYTSASEKFPMGMQSISSYIWLGQAFLAMLTLWSWDNDVLDAISSGNIVYDLCRPLNVHSMWFAKFAGARISNALLRCGPILGAAIFLPAPYGLKLDQPTMTYICFFISLLLSVSLLVSISILVYASAFYTLSSLGIRMVMNSLMELATGSIIPIPLMPEAIQKILYFTPFPYMQNIPLLIFSGEITGTNLFFYIGMQCLWLFIMICAGKLLLKHALSKVIIQGG